MPRINGRSMLPNGQGIEISISTLASPKKIAATKCFRCESDAFLMRTRPT